MAFPIVKGILILASTALVNSAPQCTGNIITANGIKPVAAPGWKWAVVASNLPSARSIEFDPKGRLIVVQSGKGLTALELTTDKGVCVKEKSRKALLDLAGLNHGLSFSKTGTTIYASTKDQAYSWDYNADAASVTLQKTLVKNMDNPDHSTRTLLKSRFDDKMLFVSRGSDDNIDFGSASLDSGRSQIRAFDLTAVPSGGYNYATTGKRIGWGLRNSVGVAEHPTTGGIYSVENSADNIKRDGVDVHETNPGEEMNYHGTLLNNKFAGQGGNYGYPACLSAFDVASLPSNKGLRVGSPFANSSSLDASCKDTIPAKLVFPSHNAPLDIKFNAGGNEGWVTFHGSWNRDNPSGYKVGVIDFVNGNPRALPINNRAVFDIFTNADNKKCPDNCFRPVGLAFDKSGRLFVSSDKSGEIYVLVKG